MSNFSKAAVNARYDQLRQQLKAGTINQSQFKASADRLYKMYHGKANKAARNTTSQPSAKPKPAGTKPVQKQSQVQKAAQSVKQSNKGKQNFFAGGQGGKYDNAVKNTEKAKSNFFRSSSGTRGQNLPSNPKLKSQPLKKPTRSSFPSGRTGAAQYAAALAAYRKASQRMTPRFTPKVNRRGRSI